jgi:hypothetical protein
VGRHLAETTRLLRWRYANAVFAALALLSAAAAMAMPGPAGALTGFSSVLVVGALALLAGHAWGILVIACSELLIVGKAWPIAASALGGHHSALADHWAAPITLLTALPGLALFVATLPYTVEVVIGAKDSLAHRTGVVLSSLAACVWLLYPAL